MTTSLLDQTLRHLARLRGQWPDISVKSGVSYHTITKIAQGQSPDPRVSTVQRLHDCMVEHWPEAQQSLSANQDDAGRELEAA